MSKCSGPFAALALGVLLASPLSAQNFSPYIETTGRGAYDQYQDALLCGAMLEWEIEAVPDSARRPHLEQGVSYTRNFALFLLESGNVVYPADTILAPDHLPTAQQNARADWRAVLDTLEAAGETPEAEIARCLSLYGYDWE